MSYYEELKTAAMLTISLNWESPFDPRERSCEASRIGHMEFVRSVSRICSAYYRGNNAVQPFRCFDAASRLHEDLWNRGVGCILTLGWVELEGNPYYYFEEQDVRAWLVSKELNLNGVDIHAWCTLDSGEVVDPSFLRSLHSRNPSYPPRTVFWADGPDRTMVYHPIVLGRDAWIGMGLAS